MKDWTPNTENFIKRTSLWRIPLLKLGPCSFNSADLMVWIWSFPQERGASVLNIQVYSVGGFVEGRVYHWALYFLGMCAQGNPEKVSCSQKSKTAFPLSLTCCVAVSLSHRLNVYSSTMMYLTTPKSDNSVFGFQPPKHWVKQIWGPQIWGPRHWQISNSLL